MPFRGSGTLIGMPTRVRGELAPSIVILNLWMTPSHMMTLDAIP
jgi:hypothetical protein